MMTPKEIKDNLKQLGATVQVDSNQRITTLYDEKLLTDEERKMIRKYTTDLMESLKMQDVQDITKRWGWQRRLDLASAIGRNRYDGFNIIESINKALIEFDVYTKTEPRICGKCTEC